MLKRRHQVPLFLLVPLLAACNSLPVVPAVTESPTGLHLPGQFVWYDLVTLNPEQARQFYGGLFGWEFEDSNKGDAYVVVKHRGVPIAGFINLRYAKREDEVHPQWISYFSVADVDASAREVVADGGAIDVKPFDLPNRGRIASLLDNRGALVAMITTAGGDPPRRDPEWNRWLWTELWTDDVDASTRFYQNLAGYELDHIDLADLGEYSVFMKGDRKLSGMVEIPDERITPNWLPYVAVEDPAAVEARVEELGGRVLASASAAANGRAAIFTDPAGAAFAVHRWPINLNTYPQEAE